MERVRYKAGIAYSKDIKVEPSPATGEGNISMILRNVAVVQQGEAKGHGTWLDQSFLEKTAELGNAAPNGIKVLFDHQTHCGTTMGYAIGRFKNFSIQGETVIADLYLFKSADASPHGELASYVQQLADEAPDVFGNSIEYYPGPTKYKTEKGFDVIRAYDEEEEVHKYFVGEEIYNKKTHGEIDWSKPYSTMAEFFASALVNEPAATSGIFSQVYSAFGIGIGGAKKAVALKKLLLSIAKEIGEGEEEETPTPAKKQKRIHPKLNKMANKIQKYDIGAKTDAGGTINIVTENSFIGVGDEVQDETGAPAPDGDHNITESDSGQSNITITVTGGIITNIAQTQSAPPPGSPSDVVMSAKFTAQEKQITALSEKVADLEKQITMLGKVTPQRTVVTEADEQSTGKKQYQGRY